MSIRDRYADFAPWVATAIGLCLVAAIAFTVIYSEGYHAANKDRQADHKSYDIAEKAYRECAGIPSVEEALRCYAKAEKASREDHRAEQGLNAQRQMADWAKWMFYATAIVGALTVGVTGVGIHFVRKTLVETQRTTWFADKAVREAARANSISKASLETARNSVERQLRAYIDVADARIEGELCDPNVVIVVKNFGQTPARNLQYRVTFETGRMPLAEPVFLTEWRPKGGVQLAPGNDVIFRFAYDVPKVLASDGNGAPVARVAGQITYVDVTGEERETHFRVRTAGHRAGENMTVFPDDTGNHST